MANGVRNQADSDGQGQTNVRVGQCRRPDEAWVELRDGAGKLQGMWDPGAGVLEIQRRGVKTRYRLGTTTEGIANR